MALHMAAKLTKIKTENNLLKDKVRDLEREVIRQSSHVGNGDGDSSVIYNDHSMNEIVHENRRLKKHIADMERGKMALIMATSQEIDRLRAFIHLLSRALQGQGFKARDIAAIEKRVGGRGNVRRKRPATKRRGGGGGGGKDSLRRTGPVGKGKGTGGKVSDLRAQFENRGGGGGRGGVSRSDDDEDSYSSDGFSDDGGGGGMHNRNSRNRDGHSTDSSLDDLDRPGLLPSDDEMHRTETMRMSPKISADSRRERLNSLTLLDALPESNVLEFSADSDGSPSSSPVATHPNLAGHARNASKRFNAALENATSNKKKKKQRVPDSPRKTNQNKKRSSFEKTDADDERGGGGSNQKTGGMSLKERMAKFNQSANEVESSHQNKVDAIKAQRNMGAVKVSANKSHIASLLSKRVETQKAGGPSAMLANGDSANANPDVPRVTVKEALKNPEKAKDMMISMNFLQAMPKVPQRGKKKKKSENEIKESENETKLEVLNLNNNGLMTKMTKTERDATEDMLCDQIGQLPDLKQISMNNASVSDSFFEKILESVKDNPSITELQFESNSLGDKSFLALTEFVRTDKQITIYKFYNNKKSIGTEILNGLIDALKENHTVLKFVYDGFRFSQMRDAVDKTLRRNNDAARKRRNALKKAAQGQK